MHPDQLQRALPLLRSYKVWGSIQTSSLEVRAIVLLHLAGVFVQRRVRSIWAARPNNCERVPFASAISERTQKAKKAVTPKAREMTTCTPRSRGFFVWSFQSRSVPFDARDISLTARLGNGRGCCWRGASMKVSPSLALRATSQLHDDVKRLGYS